MNNFTTIYNQRTKLSAHSISVKLNGIDIATREKIYCLLLNSNEMEKSRWMMMQYYRCDGSNSYIFKTLCKNKWYNAVKIFIKLFKNIVNHNIFYGGFLELCEGINTNIITQFLDEKLRFNIFTDVTLTKALKNENSNVFKCFYLLWMKHLELSNEEMCEIICMHGNPKTFKWFILKKNIDFTWKNYSILLTSCRFGHHNVAIHLFKVIKQIPEYIVRQCFTEACYTGNISLMENLSTQDTYIMRWDDDLPFRRLCEYNG